MYRAVKVAVEAVAAASASVVLDVEQRLSRQIDAVAATTRAHNDKRFDALMEVVAPMATELRELRREVVALRQGVGVLGPAGESYFAATALAGAPWSVSAPATVSPQAAVTIAVVPFVVFTLFQAVSVSRP